MRLLSIGIAHGVTYLMTLTLFSSSLFYRILLMIKNLKNGKPFKAPKYAYNTSEIYIYCPETQVEAIRSVLSNYEIKVHFNDYSLVNLDEKIITHYENIHLSDHQREFLVTATELGAWVEPLVSYLDERFGYTEVSLLKSIKIILNLLFIQLFLYGLLLSVIVQLDLDTSLNILQIYLMIFLG